MIQYDFGLKRNENNRVRFRIVRKTRVKKIEKVDESVFYPIVPEAGTSGGEFFDDNSVREAENLNLKHQKKKRARFKRNKVVPGEEIDKDTDYNISLILPEENVKSSQLLPPTLSDNFNVINTDEITGNLLYDDEDLPTSTSPVCNANQIALNLNDKNAWGEEENEKNKKSTLSNFFARFRGGTKTTKVRKFRK
ncbi:hypothetical protein AWC38_SpisGene10843 [Stylophora pistillata]|uniref:Uncharacterized protein n=1 Tax=Stylophora pistillata TaxID=50429 RepID=A0A2B4S6Y3_STYPI|nr:hypothetical protein AWC38_SpisGene10843 [Stylophora pistillata]